jgi:hypothetical protein
MFCLPWSTILVEGGIGKQFFFNFNFYSKSPLLDVGGFAKQDIKKYSPYQYLKSFTATSRPTRFKTVAKASACETDNTGRTSRSP